MNELTFVKKPNLPQNTVSTVIASSKYINHIKKLSEFGISVIEVSPISEIIGAEKYHADISAIHLGGNNIIAAKNNSILINQLKKSEFNTIPSESEILGGYPECTALNAVILGNNLICREKSVDKALYNYCIEKNFRIISVKQGYARCSTAVVSENAIITSDIGIYNACVSNKIDALKIDNGYIKIDGYDYGFIGGTCGKLSYDTLAFCGRIEEHKDYESIKAFALNHGVRLISLSNEPLFDIGGILPVVEKV